MCRCLSCLKKNARGVLVSTSCRRRHYQRDIVRIKEMAALASEELQRLDDDLEESGSAGADFEMSQSNDLDEDEQQRQQSEAEAEQMQDHLSQEVLNLVDIQAMELPTHSSG